MSQGVIPDNSEKALLAELVESGADPALVDRVAGALCGKLRPLRKLARKVDCVECGAPIGEPCLRLNGYPRISVHMERLQDARRSRFCEAST